MRSVLRCFLITAPGWLATILWGQTYIGNLNGSHAHSTFEGLSTQSLPAAGWVAVTGSPRILDNTNNMLINGAGLNYSPYSVRYVTSTAPVANMQYTLSIAMGYAANTTPGPGSASFSFSLGTWNGSTFTALVTETGGPVVYNGWMEASSSYGVVYTATYLTGGAVSADSLAVLWAQTNTSSAPTDFFGVDNVTLTVSAIPEPATHAGIAGAMAMLAAGLRRRSLRAI